MTTLTSLVELYHVMSKEADPQRVPACTFDEFLARNRDEDGSLIRPIRDYDARLA